MLATLGVVARLAIVILAGNRLTAPWSGVGDVQQYVTLASNLLAGDGFSYAHVPTAFRPPLYPLLLAALMWLSPARWPALLRAVQLAVSLATAWISSRLAARWFGPAGGRIALVAALLLPTQLYFTGEILTECTASFLGILFLVHLDDALQFNKPRSWILVGLIAGLAALDRFNAAALPLIAAAFALGWPVRPALEERRSAQSFSPRGWPTPQFHSMVMRSIPRMRASALSRACSLLRAAPRKANPRSSSPRLVGPTQPSKLIHRSAPSFGTN